MCATCHNLETREESAPSLTGMVPPADEDHDTEMPDHDKTPIHRTLPGDEAPWPGREMKNVIICEQKRDRPGHGEADQLRVGRKAGTADGQGLTTKLAEARGGELNAATALRKLRLILERTLTEAEADALDATTANEEQATLRKTLRETEREGEGDGGW